jgi:hypothetical protein
MAQVCSICGSKKANSGVCQFFCYWTLEGWLGWSGRKKMVVVRDVRAMMFLPGHSAANLSYRKTIAKARAFGWRGQENAGTMVSQ